MKKVLVTVVLPLTFMGIISSTGLCMQTEPQIIRDQIQQIRDQIKQVVEDADHLYHWVFTFKQTSADWVDPMDEDRLEASKKQQETIKTLVHSLETADPAIIKMALFAREKDGQTFWDKHGQIFWNKYRMALSDNLRSYLKSLTERR